MSMNRIVTYEHENGGWSLAVRSSERKTLPPKAGDWVPSKSSRTRGFGETPGREIA